MPTPYWTRTMLNYGHVGGRVGTQRVTVPAFGISVPNWVPVPDVGGTAVRQYMPAHLFQSVNGWIDDSRVTYRIDADVTLDAWRLVGGTWKLTGFSGEPDQPPGKNVGAWFSMRVAVEPAGTTLLQWDWSPTERDGVSRAGSIGIPADPDSRIELQFKCQGAFNSGVFDDEWTGTAIWSIWSACFTASRL